MLPPLVRESFLAPTPGGILPATFIREMTANAMTPAIGNGGWNPPYRSLMMSVRWYRSLTVAALNVVADGG